MSKINRGKDFEKVIKESFMMIPGVSIDRINDNTAGFKGVAGICDFIVYKKPYEYYIECKSVHGNRLPFHNITANQWQGLLEKSKIDGVVAGVICWWIDKDITRFIPINILELLKNQCGDKSISYDLISVFDEKTSKEYFVYDVLGLKKRVFYEYAMQDFLDIIEKEKKDGNL